MSTFVLLHGAYHGGWCWRDLRPLLTAAGHRVHTPTLTGLGERRHLASRAVDLETHVADLAGLYDWEDLQETVLVGHSYGGMVAGGFADRNPERIRALVYLDAIVPEDGLAVVDYQDPARRQAFERAVAAHDGWRLPAPPVAFYGITEPAAAAWAQARCVPQPWATFTTPLALSGGADAIARKAYIRCTDTPLAYMERFVAEAEARPDWALERLDTGHDAMITAPAALARLLLAYA